MDNPYEYEEDNGFKMIAVTFLALISVVLLAACMVEGIMWRTAEEASYDMETYAPGQPLDRVRMKAPSWSSADYMYMMVYRTNGARWLRIQMDGKWETWEICDGQGYVEQ